jgi:hypothetical protein
VSDHKGPLVFAFIAAAAVALALGNGAGSVDAQGYSTGTSYSSTATGCAMGSGPGCTVTLSAPVSAGSSVSVTLPGETTVTFTCPSGCPAGSQFTIVSASSGYAMAPAYSPPQVAYVPVPIMANYAPMMSYGSGCFNFCGFSGGCFLSCFNRFSNRGMRSDPDRAMDIQCRMMMMGMMGMRTRC